jgi:sortase A
LNRAAAPVVLAALAALVAGICPLAASAAPRPVGRIVIPAIGLDTLFFNGQAAVDTDHGPSHYPWTAMPGHGRTVAIAGHRVTHTHPFLRLGDLVDGDLIRIDYGPAPRFARRACYRVTGSTVVSPSAVWVTRDVGHERLVLTTCTPPHTALYRLVVFARPVVRC